MTTLTASRPTTLPAPAPAATEGVTCLRYYNEVTDEQACPCGCVVTR